MNSIWHKIWNFAVRNIKDAIFLSFIAISYWMVYGLGQVVGIQSEAEERAVAVGAKPLTEIHSIIEAGQTGKIIIADQAKYRDAYGNHWVIPDFQRNISKSEMDFFRANKIKVEGDVSMQLINRSAGSRHAAFSAFVDGATRIVLLMFYFIMIYFMFTQLRSSGGFFGKPFKRVGGQGGLAVQTSFDDVAGHSGPKREITEVVDYLKSPERFAKTGARAPRGVLLYGPPGNGKTLIAKAVAGEAHASYLEQNASSFVQLFVGMGAMRVRDLFKEARKNRPCVIFIDEIDAIGGHRGAGGNDERLQTINALLAELDGFENNDGLVVIAATNRLENLDEALIRPGRFDRKIFVPLPGKLDRLEILNAHAARIPRITANLSSWSERTQGFSGAYLANLVNEAAMEAARRGADTVTDDDFSKARDRMLMGPRNHGHLLSDKERTVIAHHEAGHACARIISGCGVLEKASILPHGSALGVTMSGQGDERLLVTRSDVEKEIFVLMGGRAAEEIFFGEITSGSSNDMERASKMARDAMLRYGVDESSPYVPEHDTLVADVEKRAAEWMSVIYGKTVSALKDERDFVFKVAEKLLLDDEVDGDTISSLRGRAKTT